MKGEDLIELFDLILCFLWLKLLPVNKGQQKREKEFEDFEMQLELSIFLTSTYLAYTI